MQPQGVANPPVSNPERYRQKLREKYQQKQQNEPNREERVHSRVVDVWESKNKTVRDFFIEEYEGRCQICHQTFPRRNGQPYFEAVYLISHTEAAWTDEPGNVLCLCAQCSAKFQHGSVKCPNLVENVKGLKTESEGRNQPTLTIDLIGKHTNIVFSDRHLLEVQALIRVTEDLTEKPIKNLIESPLEIRQPLREVAKPPAPAPPSKSSGERQLVQCPHCPSPVRPDRLETHITNVHKKKNQMGSAKASSQKAATTVPSSAYTNKPIFFLKKCRGCGRPAVPGDDYCYSCGGGS